MRVFFLLILPFLFLSCKEKKGYVDKVENGGDNLYSVKSDDDEMNKAIEKAKSRYDEFLSAFKNQDSFARDYTVKMRFTYRENGGEHIWVNGLHYKEDKLFGVLYSEPVKITWLKWGDTLEIKRDSLSDWMYVKDGHLVGGFTMRVLYNKMSETEKRTFLEEVDFDIE